MKRIEISTTNKVITPRKKRSKGGSVDYSYFDTAKRTVGGKTIERNIQWYRMWFTYLKLCIELQESGENMKELVLQFFLPMFSQLQKNI